MIGSQKALRLALGFWIGATLSSGQSLEEPRPGGEWPGLGGPSGNLTLAGAGVLERGSSIGLRVAWKRALGAGFSPISIASGSAVTLFSDGDDEFAGMYDPATGTERWRFRIGPHLTGHGRPGGPTSTPLIVGGRVFALSPAGRLYALDLESGMLDWSVDLPARFGSETPTYGFATSPISYAGAVIVSTGGGEGEAVTAFDAGSGEMLWSAGSDRISYQSPLLTSVGGRAALLSVGDESFTGMDPRTGRILWSAPHQGTVDESGLGARSAHVVEGGDGRFLLKNSRSGSTLFRVSGDGVGLEATPVWQSRHIKNTYSIAVYHAGYFYGYDRYVLSCVDGSTGELVWRSRSPSDGSTILVDGHLIIVSKAGTLSIAPASPEGYREVASLQLFDGDAWTPPSLAGGSLYLRNLSEWARVEIVAEPQ